MVRAGHAPSSATFRVLGMLHSTGGLQVGEIARRENASQATASNLVARLKREGLASTEPAPHDGRVTVVRITPVGQTLLEKLFQQVEAAMGEIGAELTREEIDALYAALPAMQKITEMGLK